MCFAVVTNGRVGNLFCLFALTEVRAVQQVLLCALCANSSSSSETSSRSPSFLFASACISEIFPWSKSFLRSIDRLLWLHRPGTGDLLHICHICFMKFARLSFAKCSILVLAMVAMSVCFLLSQSFLSTEGIGASHGTVLGIDVCQCVGEWNWGNQVLKQHFYCFVCCFFCSFAYIAAYYMLHHEMKTWFSQKYSFLSPMLLHLLFGWKWM